MSFHVEIIVATSMDGRISTPDRRPWRWSDPEDHAWLLSRMAAADVVVVGAATIRAENPSVTVPPEFVASLPTGENLFEVLAIDVSGNQSITESSFVKP